MTATSPARLFRLLVAAGGLLVSSAAAAQQSTVVVRGRVLGPDNDMLAAQRVVLHRVDNSGGSTVAEDTSDADIVRGCQVMATAVASILTEAQTS